MTPFSHLSVPYLGKERSLKVTGVKPLPDESHQNGIDKLSRELEQDLSKLNLNESGEFGDGDSSPMGDFDIFKITTRTEFKISTETSEMGISDEQNYPRLSEVGGLEKQIQLLSDLVLHPLETASKRKGVCVNFFAYDQF